MSCKQYTQSHRIVFAFSSILIALFIVITTPSLAKADDQSNNCGNILNKEWRSVVDTSMATLKQAITGNTETDNSDNNGLSSEEAQMITSINQERAKAGLKELVIDYSLVKLAKEKSMDMVSHNYFGHNSKELGTIYDQLQRKQIVYESAAENLAGTGNVRKAQDYLFTSPTHRWNILNPKFTKVGVGIVHGGPFGAMITQLFLG
jgi:uncharacterized protein YkwD